MAEPQAGQAPERGRRALPDRRPAFPQGLRTLALPPGSGSQGPGQGCSLGDGARTADFWAFLRKNWNESILESEVTFQLVLTAQGGLALSPFRGRVWEPALGCGPSAHASEGGRWESRERG